MLLCGGMPGQAEFQTTVTGGVLLTFIVILLPAFGPGHRNFVCGAIVRHGIDGFGFRTCRQIHFLDQCRNVVGFTIVFAAIEQACKLAGYGVCRQQNAWLERFYAESIFIGVDVVF